MRSKFRITSSKPLMLRLLLLIFLWVPAIATTESVQSEVVSGTWVSPDQKAVLCSLEDSFSAIARRVEPGVVSIIAVQQVGTRGNPGKHLEFEGLEEFFRWFFRDALAEPPGGVSWRDPYLVQFDRPPITAAGSGTIVRREGNEFYVLTNYHLVEGVYRVKVRLADDTDLTGIVVGTDPVTDLAVVRISSPQLSDRNIVPLGDSDTVKVGSWALAVGSPFGFEHTLTVGVVSALQRELEEEETMYTDLIQTDAAINRGNSGGPLLDVEGRVIGINAAIASPTGGFVGLGFAIPVNTAKGVLDELIREGRVVRGWLGVGIQDLTPVLQEYYGVAKGVLVASVDKQGPAAGAGMKDEDIIVSVSRTPISEVRQLQRLIAASQPGAALPVTVVRGGQEQVLRVVIRVSPSTPKGRPSPPPVREDAGIRVRTLTGELAQKMGLKGITGVVIVDVMPGSPAADGGLEDGDVVVTFNGRPVANEGEFVNMLGKVPTGGLVVLKVLRNGLARMIGFRLG